MLHNRSISFQIMNTKSKIQINTSTRWFSSTISIPATGANGRGHSGFSYSEAKTIISEDKKEIPAKPDAKNKERNQNLNSRRDRSLKVR